MNCLLLCTTRSQAQEQLQFFCGQDIMYSRLNLAIVRYHIKFIVCYLKVSSTDRILYGIFFFQWVYFCRSLEIMVGEYKLLWILHLFKKAPEEHSNIHIPTQSFSWDNAVVFLKYTICKLYVLYVLSTS